jgi:hypothetical protein
MGSSFLKNNLPVCSFCLDAKRTKKIKAAEKMLKFASLRYSE